MSTAGKADAAVGWYLVVVPDTGSTAVARYPSFEEVRKAVRDTLTARPEDAFFVFYGSRAHLAVDESNPSFRFLVHPSGAAMPLFDPVPQLQLLTGGSFADDADEDYIEVIEEITEYQDVAIAEVGGDPDDEFEDSSVEPGDLAPSGGENFP